MGGWRTERHLPAGWLPPAALREVLPKQAPRAVPAAPPLLAEHEDS